MSDSNGSHDSHDPAEVSLAIRAVFDAQTESVGLDAIASEAFDSGTDTRAMVECLAAITAKANCIAAAVIGRWQGPEQRKQELFNHYASLKEHMLNDMLEEMGRAES